MEKHTILQKNDYMYNVDNRYDFDSTNIKDVNNKLFCTFTGLEDLDTLISDLTRAYTIMYNKMFVLYVKSTDEYVVTYNVEQGNVEGIPMNTILVHRKKETNTLYTINALNDLIKKLNGGVVDPSFRVNWQHYKNCILLTNHNYRVETIEYKRFYKIVEALKKVIWI
jgi:hypothetical protein